MKNFTVNVFATTGISLTLLSIVALLNHAQHLHSLIALQTLGVNFVIHAGCLLAHKLELKHLLFETIFDLLVIIATLVCFGAIFGWFMSTPVWVLVIIGVLMYLISLLLNLMDMGREAQELNRLIEKRSRVESVLNTHLTRE